MKTPGEILFERHRQTDPRLDAVRRNALDVLAASESAAALQSSRREGLWIGAVFREVWLELVWPSRRAWAGMAALWLVVLTANLEMKAAFPAAPAVRSAPARELAQAIEEQRRLLAELLPPLKPSPPAPARPGPRPRSERPAILKAC
jgi:hypothetical protein